MDDSGQDGANSGILLRPLTFASDLIQATIQYVCSNAGRIASEGAADSRRQQPGRGGEVVELFCTSTVDRRQLAAWGTWTLRAQDVPDSAVLTVAGQEFRVTSPDRVLYPVTGTTKSDVIE